MGAHGAGFLAFEFFIADQISTLRPKAEVVRFAGAYFDTCAHIHTIVKTQKKNFYDMTLNTLHCE